MGPTILVAEDEEALAWLLRLLLEDAGYRVLLAADGREALARLAESRPHLVLSDMMMPGLDGRALARAMAAAPDTVLERVAEAALGLCGAGSAGISLLDGDGGRQVFRWHAVAGAFAGYLGGTLPRSFSPCGTVVDRDAVLLNAAAALMVAGTVPTLVAGAALAATALDTGSADALLDRWIAY